MRTRRNFWPKKGWTYPVNFPCPRYTSEAHNSHVPSHTLFCHTHINTYPSCPRPTLFFLAYALLSTFFFFPPVCFISLTSLKRGFWRRSGGKSATSTRLRKVGRRGGNMLIVWREGKSSAPRSLLGLEITFICSHLFCSEALTVFSYT